MTPSPAAVRAVLFDIDGTLLRSRGSAELFDLAMEEVFGIRGELRSIRPDGMTDPDIVALLLDGRTPPCGAITPRLLATFEMTLARSLGAAVAAGRVDVWKLPGVDDLLAELSTRPDARLGIVTGNMRATARVKLEAAGIGGYFSAGGYGSDSPSRSVLPAVALRRMRHVDGGSLAPEHAVVVGDTPHDLRAARAHGMRCVLVATGQYSALELAAVSPDVLLDDLSDVPRALEAIFG
ncbi:MAG: HAD family hydrolase [Thermodesulfobacteriota bacterium]